MSDERDEWIAEAESGTTNPLTNPLGLHMVQCLVAEPVSPDSDALLAALRRRCGETVEAVGEGGALLFAHPNHVVTYTEGEMPAQTVVWTAGGEKPLAATEWEAALQQTFGWNREIARAAAERHRGFVLITDLMAAGLPPAERLELFQQSVLALLDVLGENCLALRWMRAGCLVDPAQYRAAKSPEKRQDPLYPAVNIRLFQRQSGATTETVMDTLGMTAFALPDLQMHFQHLDPSAVAGFLYNIAHYLFGAGDVIEDGHTIAGMTPDSRWRCRHEMALAEPERAVLDIDPGAPYAAGNR